MGDNRSKGIALEDLLSLSRAGSEEGFGFATMRESGLTPEAAHEAASVLTGAKREPSFDEGAKGNLAALSEGLASSSINGGGVTSEDLFAALGYAGLSFARLSDVAEDRLDEGGPQTFETETTCEPGTVSLEEASSETPEPQEEGSTCGESEEADRTEAAMPVRGRYADLPAFGVSSSSGKAAGALPSPSEPQEEDYLEAEAMPSSCFALPVGDELDPSDGAEAAERESTLIVEFADAAELIEAANSSDGGCLAGPAESDGVVEGAHPAWLRDAAELIDEPFEVDDLVVSAGLSEAGGSACSVDPDGALAFAADGKRASTRPDGRQEKGPSQRFGRAGCVAGALLLALAVAFAVMAMCFAAGVVDPPRFLLPDTSSLVAPREELEDKSNTRTYCYQIEGLDFGVYDVVEVASFGAAGYLERLDITINVPDEEVGEAVLEQMRIDFGDYLLSEELAQREVSITLSAPRDRIDERAYDSLMAHVVE